MFPHVQIKTPRLKQFAEHYEKRNYNGRVTRKKPYISKVNRQKRIEFAKAFENFDESFWGKMLYFLTRLKSIFLDVMEGSKSYEDSQILSTTIEIHVQRLNTEEDPLCYVGCIGANGTGSIEYKDGIMDKIK